MTFEVDDQTEIGDHEEFNRWELGIVEDEYHDDPEALHLFWGSLIRNDEPKTPIDELMDYDEATPTGIAWHNGAPNADRVGYLENEFGVMIAQDQYNGSRNAYGKRISVTLHEVGHALSVGWADDKPIPYGGIACKKCYEVYSGDIDGSELKPDRTPEFIRTSIFSNNADPEWSIMESGEADDTRYFTATTAQYPIYRFSIEELSTIDFDHIPARED